MNSPLTCSSTPSGTGDDHVARTEKPPLFRRTRLKEWPNWFTRNSLLFRSRTDRPMFLRFGSTCFFLSRPLAVLRQPCLLNDPSRPEDCNSSTRKGQVARRVRVPSGTEILQDVWERLVKPILKWLGLQVCTRLVSSFFSSLHSTETTFAYRSAAAMVVSLRPINANTLACCRGLYA